MTRTPLLLLVASVVSLTPAGAQVKPPATPLRVVVDTLHGTPVTDAYRWLESDSEEVLAWFRAQGEYARAALGALPGRSALLERIRAIAASAPPDISLPREAGGRWFYTKREPGESVSRGYVRDGWTGEERLLVDPATVGGTTATGANMLTSFLPSPDGRLVLYGVAAGGSENAVLHVRDVASGEDIEGPIQRNRWDYNGWSLDGRAFFYIQTRDLPPDAPPVAHYVGIRIMRHRLGEDVASDVPVFSAAMVGEDESRMAFVLIDPRSALAFAIVPEAEHGAWFVTPAVDLAQGDPVWRPLFTFADSVEHPVAHGNDLYALTRKGRPRIIRTRLDAPDIGTAETILAETEGRLLGMKVALDGLYVDVFADGVSRLTRIPWGGSPEPIDFPPGTSVQTGAGLQGDIRADPLRSGVIFTLSSWTAAPRRYRYHSSRAMLEELPRAPEHVDDRLEGFTAETLFAPSHDGVGVPLTIVRRTEFRRDGALPVLLIGYGAYGATDPPDYRPERRAWFEAGGATAICHVRGGGYYGEAWRLAGFQATKPNTWLDFIACAEYLVREGYTRPERIVALGGSAGGITVGRAITERPDLFAAAIIQNGVLDMVAAETAGAGVPNTVEFGSVATEEGFRGLLAMSAYHHVTPGTAYPAVLLSAGLNDPRVASWHSAKMAATLQAATASGRPVLLRVDEAAGHMGQTAEQVQQLLADFYAFAMAQTGMPAYVAPPARMPVDRVEDLPQHRYAVPTTATELVRDDPQFAAFAQRLEADLRADLAAYDIRDRATLKSYYGTLSQIALHGGDFDHALAWQDSIAAVEDKPALKLLTGLVERAWVEAARGGETGRVDRFRESFGRAVGALPYERVQAELRAMKVRFEQTYPNLLLGFILVEVEPSAKGGEVSRELAQRLVDFRHALDVRVAVRDAAVQVLRETIAENAVVKLDIWKARDVSLEGRTDVSPVVIGIWDSGVDVSVYPGKLYTNTRETPANLRDDDGNGFIDDVYGIAFDVQHRPATALLPTLTFDAQMEARYRRLSKGFSDMQAGIDSPDAEELRRVMGTLAVEEFPSFVEGFLEYTEYAHGTHVAGIAVAASPVARILTVRETYDWYRAVPGRQTLERVEAEARKFRRIVAHLQASGARVVTMSWSYSAQDYEEILEKNNAGGSAEERRALAQRMFDISAGALHEAIASAPEILFVAAAGNDDADNRFTTSVPASLDLPNVITAGAVDRAGDEAAFTSYGKVDVYANGYEVESYLPGGEILRGSGTSMAAPQVANLAAKLLAVRPDLSVAQLRDLILRAADERKVGPDRRLKLLHPKRSLELLLER